MVATDINANLPLDKAELIAFFLEGVLFGICALLYVITLWVLVHHRRSEYLNKRLVATSSLVMFFSTLHLLVDLSHILEGFIIHREQPRGSVAYFSRLFDWSFVLKTTIFVVQTVLADMFATYRCYIVWNRTWAVLVPWVSVVATLTTGIGVVYNCAIIEPGKNVFANTLTGWITAFFTLTLATNVCCTALIASRIWYITKMVAHFSGRQTPLPVVIVVVESGTIYSISCIVILLVYLLDSNAQYPAIDGMFPVISIVFNLIIVRIALGISHGAASLATIQSNPSGAGDTSRAHSQRQSRLPMKLLAVTVTQLVYQDGVVAESGKGRTPVREDAESFINDSEVVVRKEQGSWTAV